MTNTAAVFAGQGAQSAGMGLDLAQALPECRRLFDRANEVLGFDLAGLCFNGPDEALRATNVCQPAIFVVSAAALAAYRAALAQQDAAPFAAAAGLSLGEWTALYAAGVVDFDQCVRILEARGRFMQEACEATEGAMLSVLRLPFDKVREIADAAGVTMANINSAEQIVLSGERARIAEADAAAKAAGARTVPLAVAGAYHSPLMAGAAAKLEAFLANETFREPAMPVYSNVTGRPHAGAGAIRAAMVAQVTSPVRWLDTVCALSDDAGVGRFVEFGPGRTLTGLVRRIRPDAQFANVATAAEAAAAAAQ